MVKFTAVSSPWIFQARTVVDTVAVPEVGRVTVPDEGLADTAKSNDAAGGW
jgi:hypothetical protein